MTPSEVEPATFRCLYQLGHRVPPQCNSSNTNSYMFLHIMTFLRGTVNTSEDDQGWLKHIETYFYTVLL